MRLFERLARATAGFLIGTLGGCASAPTHFYTLQHDVASATDAAPDSLAPFQIEVLPVAVPPQVDQAEFLVRQSDQRVAVLDNERWAAPLAAELRGAFAADLVAALGTRDVYGLPRAPAVPVYRIVIDIRVFDSWPGRHARIQADDDVKLIEKELQRVVPLCRWTKGTWDSLGVAWNEIQSTPRDIKRLQNALVQAYVRGGGR